MTDLLEKETSHRISAISATTTSTMLSETARKEIPALAITCWHPNSSTHHPQTTVKIAWDMHALHLRFDVRDRYVCCSHMQRQDSVCQDSCVEAFLMPIPGKGYFNFEINIAGVMLAYHIRDHRIGTKGFKDSVKLTDADLDMIQIQTDGHGRIYPEITEPLDWQVTCRIPWELFERYVGPLKIDAKTSWRGNFYKCADHSSHPHWLSWQPIGEKLSFHQPQYFGTLYFEESQQV